MSRGDGDTAPGFRHPPRRSSRPPADIDELPEPVIDGPIRTIHQYVAELHHDVRAVRSEMLNRQEAARDAIYSVMSKVDRLQACVDGLRTAQDHAFSLIRDEKRKDRWVVALLMFAIFAWVVARSYRLVGV